MKNLLSLIVFLLCLKLSAQPADTAYAPLPDENWQVGFSPLAMTANLLKFEVHKKVMDGHFLGLQGGPLVGDVNISSGNERVYKPLRGSFVKAVHKVYFPTISSFSVFYAEHGFFYHYAHLPYEGSAWESFIEDGVEYFRVVEVEKTFSSFRMGYDVSLGIEMRLDFFYMNFSLGIGYINKLSSKEPPAEYNFGRFMNGVDYQGVRILPALKIGYLIP